MPNNDVLMLMGVGGFFVFLGLVAIIWDRREAKHYYNALSDRTDLREYLEHWPQRPELGALKIGGWISIAVGVILLAVGGGFWLWG